MAPISRAWVPSQSRWLAMRFSSVRITRTTCAPSSLRITRSTPWVDGCCGPILSTSSVESRNVASGILMSLAALDTEVFPNPTVVLLNNTVILAQRVPLPLLGPEDAAQNGVAFELDAEPIG